MGKLISPFGSPRPNTTGTHMGADYGAPIGTPIYNNEPMTVGRITNSGNYGNRVELTDSNGVVYEHAHLDSVGDIRTGQQIPAGTQIGTVGDTGNAKGGAPHDHFEARDGGNGPYGTNNPESINPRTGKPYSDAFSMNDPNSGSLNSARAGGESNVQQHADDHDHQPGERTDDQKKPPLNAGSQAPGGTPTDPNAGNTGGTSKKAGRMSLKVHRLTDKNDGGGAVDEILQKTVFANNLLVCVDGSKGTGHGLDIHEDHAWVTQEGSKNVFAENIPVNFETNTDSCGHHRIEGSPDVYVGDNNNVGQAKTIGSDRPARNFKESAKSGNASPSNIACRQKKLDEESKQADPNDPNADQPQKQADIDDPNKPANDSNGVPPGTIPPDGQDPRSRLLGQLDQDYANRDQWKGGASSPAGQAAFQNVGYGKAAPGTAWCAAYLNSNLKDAGAGYAASAGSQSPMCFPKVDPANAQAGDAVVWSGHTAFIQNVNPDGTWTIQGGNQGGGSGSVTRFKIQPGAGLSGQSFNGVYSPYGTSGQTGNCKPAGGPSNPHNPNPGTNKPLGADCPPETPEEGAANQGSGAKSDLSPPGSSDTLGRSPDAIFGDPSSLLAGGGGSILSGPLSGIIGSLIGGGGTPLIPPIGGPYNSPNDVPPGIDPLVLAQSIFEQKLTDVPAPVIRNINTYERAKELAVIGTGKQDPSGVDIQRYISAAQLAWWNEIMSANQYIYNAALDAYTQAGIINYRPISPVAMTTMIAYQSGWGNSRGRPNAAYEQNNLLGVGWNGTSWYGYTDKNEGLLGMWEFVSFGTDGSLGRYMIPTNIPPTANDEMSYVYTAGFIDGNIPPAVLQIRDPNEMK